MTLGAVLALLAGPTLAQGVEILSLSRNGVITWTNASLNVTCRVEWAPSPEGPWQQSWDALRDIVVTNHVTERSIPMFFRVIQETPEPFLEDIAAEEALALIQSHELDPEFKILDVRTAGEFAGRHIAKADNLDFFSSTFESQLEALDKGKIYLVYCASGNRSGQAVQIMERLGFTRVYNLLGGFAAFVNVGGAEAYLEP